MKIEEREGQFVIVDFNEREAYAIACKVEKDGIWFYGQLLEVIADTETKMIIEHLINDERKHLAFFAERLAHLQTEEEEGFEEDNLLKDIDFGMFQPYQNMENIGEIVDDLKKALRLGITVENKSIQFYETCKEQVSDAGTQEELEHIVKEEAKHKATLEHILDKL